MVGRGWMSGASIEETLEPWAASLREVKARMRPLFMQDRVAASAGLFLDGLLGSACSRPMSRGMTSQKQRADDPQEPPLIRWSVQEIRRLAVRSAQRQIEP